MPTTGAGHRCAGAAGTTGRRWSRSAAMPPNCASFRPKGTLCCDDTCAAMTVAIVDYGSGNLRSAAKAFERAAAEGGRGERVLVTSAAAEVAAADRIALPGVGAYGDCMKGLSARPGTLEASGAHGLGPGRDVSRS